MNKQRWRLGFVLLGAGMFAAVLSPAFDALSDWSFAWHMVQHLVLFFGVPLCVLLADPFGAFLAIAGKRRTVAVLRATTGVRAVVSAPVALVVVTGFLWAAHFSPLYEASLEHEWIHVVEHLLFLAAGTLFWLPVLAPSPVRPIGFPSRLLYLLLTLPQGALLAMVILSSRSPLYAHYTAILGNAGALSDQSNAAAIMWIGGGSVVFTAFVATVAAWGLRERRALLGFVLMAFVFAFGAPLAQAGVTPQPTAAGQTPLPNPTPTPTPAPSPSPSDSVPSFTVGQARLGQTLFYENCAECHGGNLQGNFGPALAGPDGNIQWDSVGYVYSYMTGHMPAGNSGGLSKDEYLDIMSFLLKRHGHQPGKTMLTPAQATASTALLGR